MKIEPIYTTRSITSLEEIAGLSEEWKLCRQGFVNPSLESHPDWLLAAARDSRQWDRGAMVIALYQDGSLKGVVPFLMRSWEWPCRIGYKTVMRWPMVQAVFGGDTFLTPDEPAAIEAVLAALADTTVSFNVAFLECISAESSLLRLLKESPSVRQRYWIHEPMLTAPRRMIKLTGSFEEYLQKFEKERRRKLKQEIKRLEKACAGDFVFERITTRDQVVSFLQAVEIVSAASWQGTRLGQVLRQTAEQIKLLQYYASRGWLRCYLIRTSDKPLAFAIGWQSEDTYYYERTGFDPAWREWSPGKVMLMRMIEDLCANDPRSWFDFRFGEAEYKQFFCTHSFPVVNVYLVRKSVYGGLALGAQLMFQNTMFGARKILDMIGMRRSVRNLLRRGKET